MLGLHFLVLSQNPLGDLGVSGLARGLRHSPTLRQLHLSDCGLGAEGASALALALGPASSLQDLNLSLNKGVGPAGFSAIMAGLTASGSGGAGGGAGAPPPAGLRKLQLQGCGIKGCGLDSTGWGAVTAPLRVLELADNGLADAGLRLLLASLGGCSSEGGGLLQLDLRSNCIGDPGVCVCVCVCVRARASVCDTTTTTTTTILYAGYSKKRCHILMLLLGGTVDTTKRPLTPKSMFLYLCRTAPSVFVFIFKLLEIGSRVGLYVVPHP